jgi:hypothetical protein
MRMARRISEHCQQHRPYVYSMTLFEGYRLDFILYLLNLEDVLLDILDGSQLEPVAFVSVAESTAVPRTVTRRAN